MRIEPITQEKLFTLADAGVSDEIIVVDTQNKCLHTEVILDYDENNNSVVAVLDDDEGGYFLSEEYGNTWIAFDVEI